MKRRILWRLVTAAGLVAAAGLVVFAWLGARDVPRNHAPGDAPSQDATAD